MLKFLCDKPAYCEKPLSCSDQLLFFVRSTVYNIGDSSLLFPPGALCRMAFFDNSSAWVIQH